METKLLRQIRVLQVCVVVLLLATTFLGISLIHPLLPRQNFKVINAERINIREPDGTLRAALSNSAGFKEAGRAHQDVRFAGLMFYNEEGHETGGLTYSGRLMPGGQDADVTLAFDQFRQDQNVYLHHEEARDEHGLRIDDGLTVNARPDYTGVKEEYSLYNRMQKLPPEQRAELELKSLQAGKISTRRLFFGVVRGVQDNKPFDYSGVFIRNKWGRNAIRLYVDDDNKPHFEIYDPLGKSMIYEFKLPHP